MITTEWKDNTGAVKSAMERAIEEGLEKSAWLVHGDATNRAPVDTGNLKTSISVGPIEKSSATVFVDDVGYDKYVEFGTVKQAPQPYLRPALDENKAKINAIINTAIKGALK